MVVPVCFLSNLKINLNNYNSYGEEHAKGLLIVRVDITDQEKNKEYVAANAQNPSRSMVPVFWCEPVNLKILKVRVDHVMV